MRMHEPETPSVETLDARFLRTVEAYCEHRAMSGRAFGDAALGDLGFVSSLRRGRSPCVSTLDPVLVYMGDAPPVLRLNSRFSVQWRAELNVAVAANSVPRPLQVRAMVGEKKTRCA